MNKLIVAIMVIGLFGLVTPSHAAVKTTLVKPTMPVGPTILTKPTLTLTPPAMPTAPAIPVGPTLTATPPAMPVAPTMPSL